MKKVYCKNCHWRQIGERDYCRPRPFPSVNQYWIIFKDTHHYSEKDRRILLSSKCNKDNDCDYWEERRWWKFWVWDAPMSNVVDRGE